MPRIDSQRHAIFTSDEEKWRTPQELFDLLDAEFNFTLDVCAIASNAKCSRYFTPEQNALLQTWEGICWMNPPYGKDTSAWMRKAFDSAQAGAVVVCLLPARTDTRWFHQWVIGRASIRFIYGRLTFGGCNGSGKRGNADNVAPFPSMILVYDNNPPTVTAMRRPNKAAAAHQMLLV